MRFLNAGTTQNRTKNRALLRFDLTPIPTGTQIRAVSLALEVVGQPNEPPAFSDFGVYRVLRSWAEGAGLSPTNCVSCQGQGSLASIGEPTWDHRSAFGTGWERPGGALGGDFAAEPSASTTVYGIADSPYTFPSTSRLLADVQFWVDRPEANYGWALSCQSEEVPFTARRFASREDIQNAPRLTLDFVAPPQLQHARKADNDFEFSFLAFPGEEYQVEYRETPLTSWKPLGPVHSAQEPGLITIRDPITPDQRYYRILAR